MQSSKRQKFSADAEDSDFEEGEDSELLDADAKEQVTVIEDPECQNSQAASSLTLPLGNNSRFFN